MDSQEQYEALLAKWGFEDTSAQDYARRQKRIRQAKALVVLFKTTISAIKKVSIRPQKLPQANL